MDWSKFKLGIGPMSPEVVDACLAYSNYYQFPLMVIASRNQVDYDNGYSFKTKELVNHITSNSFYNSDLIKICRDHCGPNFADVDKTIPYDMSVHRCKETIKEDITNNFDLIHIDVSRVEQDKQDTLAVELIDYALSLNPNIAIEFGCEDNTGLNLLDNLHTVDKQIEFAKKYKNIVFLVNQTGSLTKHTQIGTFNVELSQSIANRLHNNNFLFKEHNGDYLNKNQAALHYKTGIDSINIAPQLGYIHTLVLNKLGYYYPHELKKFKEYVLNQGAWRKWVVDGIDDEQIKFLVSAHYYYKSEYSLIINDIIKTKKLPFNEMLYNEISIALDQYRLGIGEKHV
jgi:tagatose-1,6-bisphosphate aldolase non-catalytic subunit AgaZ/GatZ